MFGYPSISYDIFIHCNKVAFYAVKIAGDDKDLFMASLLHDIGKRQIPDSILKKPGPLTDDEYKIIRKHPEEGAKLVEKMGYSDKVVKAVLHHHECWDGNGYPYGLKGKNIPLYSRILAVADAFDAMTCDRPYRKALSTNAAVAQLKASAGTQFDPKIVTIFLENIIELPSLIIPNFRPKIRYTK
jgi:putative nucleotidyltransferase with HDIG domain